MARVVRNASGVWCAAPWCGGGPVGCGAGPSREGSDVVQDPTGRRGACLRPSGHCPLKPPPTQTTLRLIILTAIYV